MEQAWAVAASKVWITGKLFVDVVVRRDGDTHMEYWTGSGWSTDAHDAIQYDSERKASGAASSLAKRAS